MIRFYMGLAALGAPGLSQQPPSWRFVAVCFLVCPLLGRGLPEDRDAVWLASSSGPQHRASWAACSMACTERSDG